MALKIKYATTEKPQTLAAAVVRVDTAQVLAQLSCTRYTLISYIKNRGFPPPKYLGSRRLWLQSEVTEWIEKNLRDEPEINNFDRAA